MAYKKRSVPIESLPESAQPMLMAFEDCFSPGDYTVTHVRSDAVFVQCFGICNLYLVARFINHNPNIYVELQADARGFWTLRMFSSEWHREHSIPRCQRLINDLLTITVLR